jgi:23S rRNA (pseudouridine1915-N3)-methyltransferase|tara:strand:+ start:7668 stop:8153 length:486 start_codon:yes stop_codon:yes gene_type:complete
LKFEILAVSKIRDEIYKNISNDYKKKIIHLGKNIGLKNFEIIEINKSTDINATSRKVKEAELMLNFLKKNKTTIIALDENGVNMSSQSFSDTIKKVTTSQNNNVIFIIGGPDGLDSSIIKKADISIAFGAFTWPHKIARILLQEQIYRAISIICNHPYHRI